MGSEMCIRDSYKDNPNVTVVLDRREGPDRRSKRNDFGGLRETRDRRRARAPGTFPSTDPPPDTPEAA